MSARKVDSSVVLSYCPSFARAPPYSWGTVSSGDGLPGQASLLLSDAVGAKHDGLAKLPT